MSILKELYFILESEMILKEDFVQQITDVNYTIPAGILISKDGGKTTGDDGGSFKESFSIFDTSHFNKRAGIRSIGTSKLIEKLKENNNSLLENIVNDILVGNNVGDGKAIVLDQTDPKNWVAYIFEVKIKEIENAKVKNGGYGFKNSSIKLITTVDRNSSKYTNKDLFFPVSTNNASNARMYILDKNKLNVVNSNRYKKDNWNKFHS